MRLTLCIILFLITHYSSNAQVRELGVKTGISNSLIRIKALNSNSQFVDYNTSNGQSLYTQFYAQVYKVDNFSLQAGTGLIEKNSKYNYKIKVSGITDSVTVNTQLETRAFLFELNAKLKAQIPELPKVIPYIIVGAQYSILNKQTNTIPFTLAKTQTQGVIGIGADLDINKIHFFAEYNRLLNFNANYSKDSNYQFEERTGLFLIGLKFLIKPKKA